MAQAPAKPELMLETVTTSEETLIRCIGKMTYTSAEALRRMVRPLFPETKRVVLDLKETTYLDSFGLGVLVGCYSSARGGLSTETHQCESAGRADYTG
jgi:anti-anti-sigma factor